MHTLFFVASRQQDLASDSKQINNFLRALHAPACRGCCLPRSWKFHPPLSLWSFLHSSECAYDEIWNSEKCGQMLLASGAGDPDRSLRCQRTPRQMLVVGVIPRVVFSYYANVVPIPRIEVPVRGHTIHVDHMNLWQRWLQKHTRAYTRNMQT